MNSSSSSSFLKPTVRPASLPPLNRTSVGAAMTPLSTATWVSKLMLSLTMSSLPARASSSFASCGFRRLQGMQVSE